MKKICYLFSIIAIAISSFSCSKEDKFKVEITVKDFTNVNGATVSLYTTVDDFINETNAKYSAITNSDGIATFNVNKIENYYIRAKKGCKGNYTQTSSIDPIIPSTSYIISVVNSATTAQKTVDIKEVGTLVLTNTSTKPFKIYLNGQVLTQNMDGKTTNTYPVEAKTNTIRVVQINGYNLYPTDNTYERYISCGGTVTISFTDNL